MPEIINNLKFCDNCGQPITYEKDEVFRLNDETVGFICPNCSCEVVVDYIKPFTFPDSFYHFGANSKSVKLTDQEIQRYVNSIKFDLQNEIKAGEFTITGTGDTVIIGMKCDDEDVIIVAKDYWEERMTIE